MKSIDWTFLLFARGLSAGSCFPIAYVLIDVFINLRNIFSNLELKQNCFVNRHVIPTKNWLGLRKTIYRVDRFKLSPPVDQEDSDVDFYACFHHDSRIQ